MPSPIATTRAGASNVVPQHLTVVDPPANPHEKDAATETDYQKMTAKELKARLDDKGVTYASGASKADLVSLLEDADNEDADTEGAAADEE